jgi:hypothetical protein
VVGRIDQITDAECRSCLSFLKERVGQHEGQLATLQFRLVAAVQRFETNLARLASDLKTVSDAKNSDSPVQSELQCLRADQRSRRQPQCRQFPHRPPGEYPPLFEEFRMKRWLLLW